MPYLLVFAMLLFIALGVTALCFLLIPEQQSKVVEAEPFKQDVVVVSMTTSPERLPNIIAAIDSLYERQTRKPDFIVLNMPHVFLRTQQEYDLGTFPYADKPYIVINRCDDIGPITKFVPTVRLLRAEYPDARIIVADDDIEYPPRLIEVLVECSARKPDAVVTTSCTRNYYTTAAPEKCELVEGYQSYLVKPRFFGSEFDAYLETALADKGCFKGDDYVLSNFIHTNDIPVVLCAEDPGGPVRPIEYGLQDDALHKQIDTQHHERYCDCFRHLQEAGVPIGIQARCPIE